MQLNQTGQVDVELEINFSKSVYYGAANVFIDKTIYISKLRCFTD